MDESAVLLTVIRQPTLISRLLEMRIILDSMASILLKHVAESCPT